jgi:hypothetical protein
MSLPLDIPVSALRRRLELARTDVKPKTIVVRRIKALEQALGLPMSIPRTRYLCFFVVFREAVVGLLGVMDVSSASIVGWRGVVRSSSSQGTRRRCWTEPFDVGAQEPHWVELRACGASLNARYKDRHGET